MNDVIHNITNVLSCWTLLYDFIILIDSEFNLNIFWANSTMDAIITYAGVFIFVGLTAYDTQKIKQMLMQAPDASESAQKRALLGALTLYLDFINLFIYLLRIFGKRE